MTGSELGVGQWIPSNFLFIHFNFILSDRKKRLCIYYRFRPTPKKFTRSQRFKEIFIFSLNSIAILRLIIV